MKTFSIEPYVGAIPIRFGMSPDDVQSILGLPVEILPQDEIRIELRDNLSLGYDSKSDKLDEVVFSPGAKVFFEGHDLFSEKDLISFLQQYDPEPKYWVGFVLFLELGIRLSGFHYNDESQKAIGVVKKSHWDEYVDDFEPFKMPFQKKLTH